MASGRHLLDLINDVLDISKIESGKATLNLTEFDLGDSLVAIESIIAPMARDKRQAFHTEIRSTCDHERVIGDETHINQILHQPPLQRREVHAGGRRHLASLHRALGSTPASSSASASRWRTTATA